MPGVGRVCVSSYRGRKSGMISVPCTPSSGRVATPAAELQMLPSPMRHEDNAAAAQYESLRAACAGHRHAVVISKAADTYLAEGAMSVLFKLCVGGCAYAVKFDKGSKWPAGKAQTTKSVASISAAEIDVMCMVWYMLSARGLSPHVPRVFGVLTFTFGPGAVPYCGDSGAESHGLVMELMDGYQGAATLKALLKAGMAGKVRDAGGADAFGDTLRAVVFQVLYTIAMWSTATGGNFRHNDLHAQNICLTYWNEEHTPVEVEYHLPGADGTDRVFVLRTPLCATIIDFGYAAILQGAGGPVFDPRFYYFGRSPEALSKEGGTRGNTLAEPKLKLWGMSHRQQSRHYDVLLFAYAILHDFNVRKCKHAASTEFHQFYARSWGSIHSCPAYMHQKSPCNGRLTAHGQRELMRSKTVTARGRSFVVMDAADALMDVYFAPFRGCGTTPPRAVVFGLAPSPAAVAPPLSKAAMARTGSHVIFNEADVGWKPRLSRAGKLENPPRPGLWSRLVATLDALKGAVPPSRPLTRAELAAWAGPAADAAACDAAESEYAWEDCAPGEDL